MRGDLFSFYEFLSDSSDEDTYYIMGQEYFQQKIDHFLSRIRIVENDKGNSLSYYGKNLSNEYIIIEREELNNLSREELVSLFIDFYVNDLPDNLIELGNGDRFVQLVSFDNQGWVEVFRSDGERIMIRTQLNNETGQYDVTITDTTHKRAYVGAMLKMDLLPGYVPIEGEFNIQTSLGQDWHDPVFIEDIEQMITRPSLMNRFMYEIMESNIVFRYLSLPCVGQLRSVNYNPMRTTDTEEGMTYNNYIYLPIFMFYENPGLDDLDESFSSNEQINSLEYNEEIPLNLQRILDQRIQEEINRVINEEDLELFNEDGYMNTGDMFEILDEILPNIHRYSVPQG
ncbi:MAG: hypothetical protein Q9M91_05450 [Candidatus Dojkabacteria bacterium]|nr:hypothetical protein [Candidatus Dojkabacteria bacterium]MDQ7021248.1 hypothetical protein [Candidatus Dojkabacteria bacterium]